MYPENQNYEKFREEIDDKFSNYTTWTGKTENGCVYINTIKNGEMEVAEDINMVYITKNKRYCYWIGRTGKYDHENKEFGIQVGEYSDGNFYAYYNAILEEDRLRFQLRETNSTKFPEQLAEIIFEKEDNAYLVAVQNYLSSNIKNGYLKRIQYERTKENDLQENIRVIGIYVRNTGEDADANESDYDVTFVVKCENGTYNVYMSENK